LRPLAIENKNAAYVQRGHSSRPTAAIEEFHFKTVEGQQFNNRPDIADFNVLTFRRSRHGYDVEQLWFS